MFRKHCRSDSGRTAVRVEDRGPSVGDEAFRPTGAKSVLPVVVLDDEWPAGLR
jgi:hypothetical protein